MAVRRAVARPHCKACLLRKIGQHTKYGTSGEVKYHKSSSMSRCIVCGYMAEYALSITFGTNEDLLGAQADLLSIDDAPY